MRYDPDRFSNYREIQAKRHSIASCSHGITVGERIGWNPRTKKTVCRPCWVRWVLENDAADIGERFGY